MSQDMLDFDFDTPISEVADLVAYSNPANGTHIYGLVFCGMDMSRGDDPKVGVSFVYQKLGTVELAKEDDVDAPFGSIIKENFTGNKTAKEIVKLRLTQIFGKEAIEKTTAEGGSFRPFIEELNKLRTSQFYLQLVTKVVERKGYENLRILDVQVVSKDSVKLPEGFEFFDYQPTLPEDLED